MFKLFLTALSCCAALLSSPAQALVAADPSTESGLRQALQQTLWPADIVRLADDYLQRFPSSDSAASVAQLREQASGAVQVLSRNDVRLFKSAFQAANATPAVLAELRRAALGDKNAAVRLAHLQLQKAADAGAAADASDASPVTGNRYVGWLQFAALLGNDAASYELALHFRRQGQPMLASQYEARAVQLGYQPPRALDHVRK